MLRDTILELEKKLLLNNVRVDEEELDKLLHRDFSEIGSSGSYFIREDYFKGSGAGERDLEILDFKIQEISSKNILSLYRVIDYERDNITLRSSIWVYENDSWQLYFHQGTVERVYS